MDQVVDRPQSGQESGQETETCAKWTLGRVLRSGALRTGALLAAAAFAALLTVDLPVPAGRAAVSPGAASYVPASDKWIELGAPQRPATRADSERLQAELLRLQGAGATASPIDAARPQSRRASAT
jgi:hypothetical protein